ncbi:DUF2846 domain-containing protein [Sedimenticola sp.]|uniref:DUF2846 domain-containing protein n=1 Tax=Sedimenticola sp. TaxID=1940285 RepID=UPI003D13D4EF
MNKYKWIIWVILFGIAGCAATTKYVVSPDWDKSKLATVYIYRTDVSFHRFNPEKPYFYIDNMEVGKLGTGEAIAIEVLPGPHVVTAKEPILFIPTYESGRLEFDAKQNEKYYVRYSKEFGGVNSTGNSPKVSDKTSIQLANEEDFGARR